MPPFSQLVRVQHFSLASSSLGREHTDKLFAWQVCPLSRRSGRSRRLGFRVDQQEAEPAAIGDHENISRSLTRQRLIADPNADTAGGNA